MTRTLFYTALAALTLASTSAHAVDGYIKFGGVESDTLVVPENTQPTRQENRRVEIKLVKN